METNKPVYYSTTSCSNPYTTGRENQERVDEIGKSKYEPAHSVTNKLVSKKTWA